MTKYILMILVACQSNILCSQNDIENLSTYQLGSLMYKMEWEKSYQENLIRRYNSMKDKPQHPDGTIISVKEYIDTIKNKIYDKS